MTGTGNIGDVSGQEHRSPPASENELLARAQAVAGLTLAELAGRLGTTAPPDLLHDKGWAGQLLEIWLGASSASLPEPDFPNLGIELKTLPIDGHARPLESTYVCSVDLQPASGDWQSSVVWRKLKKVLWLPLLTERGDRPGNRRIATAVLWSPSEAQAAVLQRDWEELMELVSNGELERISSRQGQYLQIRPKAANARALTSSSDTEGNRTMTLPRGFYLRPVLTRQILLEHYHL